MNAAVDESDSRPLVAHIVFRFDYGGLENGVANLLNGMTGERLRHAVIAMTEATSFAERLPPDVRVYEIGKQPGKDPRAYVRLYRLLRRLAPTVVHTRNVGTIDCAFVAFLARVPVRIHGEHGWDVFDPDGTNRKYRLVRQAMSPFIDRFVTVSRELAEWLHNVVGIPHEKITRICNGVDTVRFRPAVDAAEKGAFPQVGDPGRLVVGSVTRFSEIKDPLNLVKAFRQLTTTATDDEGRVRPFLVMAGDGELYEEAREMLDSAGLSESSWLPGSRDDVPELMHSFDLFVLGSLREGISNTVLEAMASGLPVIASDTGGNPELVRNGVNGVLVTPGDTASLVTAISQYLEDPELCKLHGKHSREIAEREFSLSAMIESYRSLYNGVVEEALA